MHGSGNLLDIYQRAFERETDKSWWDFAWVMKCSRYIKEGLCKGDAGEGR